MNDRGVHCPACGKPMHWNPEPNERQLAAFNEGRGALRAVCRSCGRVFDCSVEATAPDGLVEYLRRMQEVRT